MNSRLIQSLTAAGAMFATAVGAHANVYTDLDVFNGVSGVLVNAANPYSGYFQISVQDADGIPDIVGFDSSVESIHSAYAEFTIWDDQLFDRPETVKIDLGSDTFVSGQSATFLIAVGQLSGNAIIDLDADGVLKYTITATQGDFKAIKGVLVATACPVPDGGATMAMLGFGLVGLGLVRRRAH